MLSSHATLQHTINIKTSSSSVIFLPSPFRQTVWHHIEDPLVCTSVTVVLMIEDEESDSASLRTCW